MIATAIPAPAIPAVAVDPSARAGIACGLGAALVWASYTVLARHGVLAGLTPNDLTFFRFGAAGLIMLPFLLRAGAGDLAGIGWRRGLALALFAGPMFSLLLMSGFALAPANHGAVIAPAALTGAGVLLSAAVLRERLPAARLLGVPVIFAGLGLIGWAGLRAGGGGLVLLGDLLFALAGISWAVFTVLLRRWSIDPVRGTAVVAVLAMLAYTPLWLATADLTTLAAAGPAEVALQVVAQGALAGVVAVLAFSRAVALLGASRAALFPSLVPAVAVLLAVPVLGEVPSPLQLAGLAVVTLGLAAALGLIRLSPTQARPGPGR